MRAIFRLLDQLRRLGLCRLDHSASENQGRASPWIKWNSINSDGALCGSFDRNVLLKTYRDTLRARLP